MRVNSRIVGPRRLMVIAMALTALTLVVPSTTTARPRITGGATEWGTITGTDGRVYIADGQGRALQFHGFNIKSAEPASIATPELLATVAPLGLDHIRLAWFWQDLEPTQDGYDDAYVAEIRTVMDRAEAVGMKVILDMHQDVFGEEFGERGVPIWATRTDGLPYEPGPSFILNYLQPAVQAAWEHLYEDDDLRQWQIEAWTYMVERVTDHPALIGYDLLNEPFGKLREGEDLFEAAARVEATQLTPMYQRLTDAITAIDADHWIFIEPPNLASLGVVTSLGEVTGAKVAVYPHMYDPDIELATYSGGDDEIEFNPEFFERWADAISVYTDRYEVPMLVGEWGISEPELPGMDKFVAASLDTIDEVASGWSQFAGCFGGGYCPVDPDGNPRPGIGQIFQPYARAIAGSPTSTSWDRTTSELQVRFVDNETPGPTEIWIGEDQTYPQGWRIETSATDEAWTMEYDEDTDIAAVSFNEVGGPVAICVKPADAPAGCTAVDPPPPASPANPASPAGPSTPVPAVAVPGQATFTG